MSGFGLQDIGYVGGASFGARQNGEAGGNAAGTSFEELLGQAGASQAQAASSDNTRRSMADPADWAATHGAPAGNPADKSEAAQQLSDYLSMPLSQRMFYMVLASMGITPEQYEAMSPEEKAKLAVQVAQRLKENAEAQAKPVDRKDEVAVSA